MKLFAKRTKALLVLLLCLALLLGTLACGRSSQDDDEDDDRPRETVADKNDQEGDEDEDETRDEDEDENEDEIVWDTETYFERKPHKELCYDMSQYDDALRDIRDSFFEEGLDIDEAMRHTRPLPSGFNRVVEEGNQLLIDFFADEYGLDVEDEMDELKVVHTDLGDYVAGVFYFPQEGVTDGNTIAVHTWYVEEYEYAYYDDEYFTEWKVSFFGTYLHEALHYLGSACWDDDDIDWMYLVEGITEALTEAVITYGGYEFVNDSAYILNTDLAKQLLIADKELIVWMIDGYDYVLSDEMDAYFDDKSFDGMGEALEQSVSLVMEKSTKKYKRMAQHLMGEYLKHYDLTEEQMEDIAQWFLVPVDQFAVAQ